MNLNRNVKRFEESTPICSTFMGVQVEMMLKKYNARSKHERTFLIADLVSSKGNKACMK